MKIIFFAFNLVIILPFLLSSIGNARELVTIDQVIRQGLHVKMGELTGAGSKVSLQRLAGLVLPDGILMKEDFNEILIKNTVDPKISDIVKIKHEGQDLMAVEFIGFVIH